MEQKIIEITQTDPQLIFGKNNAHIALFEAYFPKMKIVARGNQMLLFGQPQLLEDFENRLKIIIQQAEKFNKLDPSMVQEILKSENPNALSDEIPSPSDIILHGINGKIIRPKTANQKKLVKLIQTNDMVFAVGPAGTGKTYTSVALAVQSLKSKQVRRIILTRPAVEAGENLGFLPGDLKEKLDPYMQPLYDALMDMIPAEKLHSFLEKGVIQIAPLAFMRGRTLDDAFVILDEAQNTTQAQMKMFLTRMGNNAKFIITGDPGQIDLPQKTKSGLKQALHILKKVDGIGILHLNDSDVIRHPLVKTIIKAYDKEEKTSDTHEKNEHFQQGSSEVK